MDLLGDLEGVLDALEAAGVDYAPVLERAWQTRAAYPWRGRHMTAVSIEGLTEMKRMAGRKQDLADLEHLGVPEEDA
jgi:hypothetical protein